MLKASIFLELLPTLVTFASNSFMPRNPFSLMFPNINQVFRLEENWTRLLLGENRPNVFDQHFRQSINEFGQNQYECTLCDMKQSLRSNMWNHVESQHFPGTFTYPCQFCPKEYKTRNAWSSHVSRYHK